MKRTQLPPAERDVLACLYRLPEATAGQIRESLLGYRLSALGFIVFLGLGFLLLPGLRSQTATQETAAEASPAWGPTEKGLKIGVERPVGGAEILVHFKNVSTNDMALKLGIQLRNYEVRYPHAILWRLIDPGGATHKLDYSASSARGQPEPFIVRIPSGATYSLSFLSDHFCEIRTGNRLSSLEHGQVRPYGKI